MKRIAVVLLVLATLSMCPGCADYISNTSEKPEQVSVKIPTNAEGITIEQKNIRNRLLEDNKPGAVKHLYVISAYSGQVIIYSTIDGKVTSGGKRLSATTRGGSGGDYFHSYESEIIGDDGTYGSSGDYIFWWDVKGTYHQHYLSGGQIVHVSSVPIPVKGIIINLEMRSE